MQAVQNEEAVIMLLFICFLIGDHYHSPVLTAFRFG
jgi:hypothetical protein